MSDLKAQQQAIRQTRDHARAHNYQQGCVQCDLWRAFALGSEATFDAVLERIESDELRARAEAMREFGEGTWTDKETEE